MFCIFGKLKGELRFLVFVLKADKHYILINCYGQRISHNAVKYIGRLLYSISLGQNHDGRWIQYTR